MSDENTTTAEVSPKIEVNDTVSFVDNDGNEVYGTVSFINEDNKTAVVNVEDGPTRTVNLSDLQVAEYKVIAEIDGVEYTEKAFRKGKAGQDAILSGYKFATPRFKDVDQLRSHLNALLTKQNKHKDQDKANGHTADEIILDNFHSMVDNKLRTRVKNDALDGYDPAKPQTMLQIMEKLKKFDADKFLFTPEQAANWIPGIREASGMSKVKILAQLIKDLQAQGKTVADPELMNAVMEMASLLGK